MRYLEDCIAKLKAQHEADGAAAGAASEPVEGFQPSPLSTDDMHEEDEEPEDDHGNGNGNENEAEDVDININVDADEGEEQTEDVEMTGSEAPSPVFAANPSSHSRSHSYANFQPYPSNSGGGSTHGSHHPSVSPALLPQDAAARDRQHSYSSASTTAGGDAPLRHYSTGSGSGYATSSPVSGPRGGGAYAYGHSYGHSYGGHGGYGYTTSAPHSALTSPALAPQTEDQEATAALLMLNADRRGLGAGAVDSTTRGGNAAGASASAGAGTPARGMSVRDLLSS